MSYDSDGDKIHSEGPDGFIEIDFSRFKEIWDNVAEPGEEPPTYDEINAMIESMPESPVVNPTWCDDQFLHEVARRIRAFRVDAVAREQYEQEIKPPFEPPVVYSLPDFLLQPDNPTKFKVADLWPLGGNVLFAAPAKFGKSTMIMNLIRSLLDGTAYLGEFAVQPLAKDETILLVDLEMSQDRVRSELRAQGIQNLAGLRVASLRGLTKQFDVTADQEARAYWVKYCQQQNVKTIIIDPLAPMLGHLSIDENDNTLINRFFQQLDEFKAQAGIRDMIVVHHCGHTADWRPRGASRFNDWPDALWLCKLVGDLDDNPDRKFFARGRDVGDEFNGAGLVTRDPQNNKILRFAHGTSSSNADVNAQGVLNTWVMLVHERTGKPVSQKDLKLWAAAQDRSTPDGQIIVIGDDKCRSLLEVMVNSGEVHGCTWREQGRPVKYVPGGTACQNPHCGV